MASPLAKHTEEAALLPPLYFGSIVYYATLASYTHAYIDLGMRYDKRFKQAHRCEIVDTRGRLSLTVPVEKVTNKQACAGIGWDTVNVSAHGDWWAKHITALESAYGRTPFFEYYIDRLKPWIANLKISVGRLDAALDAEIRRILGIETLVEYVASTAQPSDDSGQNKPVLKPLEAVLQEGRKVVDYRNDEYPGVRYVEYYQVRADRLGFEPGLSIVDLICNMGPEAPLVLKEMTE